MKLDDLLGDPLNEHQKIIIERIKKAVAGLTVKEAKEVLFSVLSEIENQSIVDFNS